MTIKEELMKLQTYKLFEDEEAVYVDRNDVLELLEQEPCLISQGLAKDSQGFSQEHCDDAISRQAALYGLASIAKAKAKSDAQKALMGRVMFFIGQLPPVTPKPKVGYWIEEFNDLEGEVKLDEAIKRYFDNAEYERTHGNLQGCLEFRQFAKLLKELKAYRKICHKEHVDDCSRAERSGDKE